MDKKSPKVTDCIFCFMEQLNVVECDIGIPAQAIESWPKSHTGRLYSISVPISSLIKYFGQCRHLMQKDPDKYYMWLRTHEHGGEQANYVQIERKYCQMIFLAETVFQKAGLQDEFKKAVAKANEELKLWRKEHQSPKAGQHNESVNYQDNRNANFNVT